MTDLVLRAAFVTGGHSFEVQALHHMLHKLQGIRFYTQHIDDFVKDRGSRDYDVIVFYNMGKETPQASDGFLERTIQPIIEECGEKGIGFVVLHHAILSYPDWDLWNEVVGISDRTLFSYSHDQEISIEVQDRSHPITQGITSWQMIDEIYVMADPEPKSRILLANPNSEGMKAIGWTGAFRNSKVFCFQSGHDHQAYNNDSFQLVLRQGVLWAAGR
jgi:uncharacterized protein